MVYNLSIDIGAGVAVYEPNRRSLMLGSGMAFEVPMPLEYLVAWLFGDQVCQEALPQLQYRDGEQSSQYPDFFIQLIDLIVREAED